MDDHSTEMFTDRVEGRFSKATNQMILCDIDSPDSEFAHSVVSAYLNLDRIPFLNQSFVIVSYQVIDSANKLHIEFLMRRIP
jgi:hypothetical protein